MSDQTTSKQAGSPMQADDDPANPTEAAVAAVDDDRAAAIALTNYGEPGVNQEFDLTSEQPAVAAAAPEVPLDITEALDFLNSCMHSTPRVTYGLGAKISP